ncbi:MAG: Gfo/Idh/MocA family protein [Fimbriimonas sp.]
MRVGILGAGGMGNVHARQYRKMADVDLRFFDPDPERSETFRGRWEAESLASSSELIDWADVVDVCLPTDLHVDIGLAALGAGKATFIEKPLAGNLTDARRLVEAGGRLGVGHVVRYFPEFAAGRATVVSGGIGTPAAARTRRGGTAPSGLGGWFMDHSRSGGVLIDLAIHDFDWLRWTLGEVKLLYSRSVGAKTGHGPDYALTTLTFESGAVAHVESTWMDPSGFRTAFEVAGSGGLIEFDSRTTPSLRTHTVGATATESNLSATDDPYYRQLRAFLDAITTGSELPVSGLDGFAALSIALAARESAQTGKVVVPERWTPSTP